MVFIQEKGKRTSQIILDTILLLQVLWNIQEHKQEDAETNGIVALII